MYSYIFILYYYFILCRKQMYLALLARPLTRGEFDMKLIMACAKRKEGLGSTWTNRCLYNIYSIPLINSLLYVIYQPLTCFTFLDEETLMFPPLPTFSSFLLS